MSMSLGLIVIGELNKLSLNLLLFFYCIALLLQYSQFVNYNQHQHYMILWIEVVIDIYLVWLNETFQLNYIDFMELLNIFRYTFIQHEKFCLWQSGLNAGLFWLNT